MPKFRDITGQQFGKLIALEVSGKDSTNKTMWLCQCECGNKTTSTMLNLVKEVTKSCGCLKHQPSKLRHNLSGMRFGSLVAMSIADGLKWFCLCDCGKSAVVRTVHLTHNHTRSCGQCNELKSGLEYENRRARNSIQQWSRIAKQLGECDACGSTNNLHAHHIIPFSVSHELRHEIENSSCLCASCHREVHREIVKNGNNYGKALSYVIFKHSQAERGINIVNDVYLLMQNGLQDLYKAKHYLEKLIEVETELAGNIVTE